MSAKSLNSLLQQKSQQGLADLVDKAKKMVDLSVVVAQALPPELASEIQGTNIRDDGVLVVLAASSPAAARLRFEGDTLLAAAASHGFPVQTLSVKVGRRETGR